MNAKLIIIQTQVGIWDLLTRPMMKMVIFYSNFQPVDTV